MASVIKHVPITLTWKVSASIETKPKLKTKIKAVVKCEKDPSKTKKTVKKILDDGAYFNF